MRIEKLVGVFVLALLVQACGNNERTTPFGLKYTVIEEGEGEIVQQGEYLLLNMLYKDNNDSIWQNSAEQGVPINIAKRDSAWTERQGSIQEIFYELKKGDSITFDINAKKLFVNTWGIPVPEDRIDPNSVVTFYVGVEDLLDQEAMNVWRTQMIQKQQAERQKAADLLVQADKEKIDNYLSENNISAQETETGLQYVIKEEGNGDKPEVGQKVRVNYTGYVLGGGYFDTSSKEIAEEKGIYNPQREPYEPIEFPLGQGRVIRGWDEGIALLSEGGKATLYIPSGLAYGPQARGKDIPANSTLIFDVELVEVIEE